jgi:uncharacterized protein (DUF58 family)
VAARRRGLVRCGRLEVFTRYPVGLFHAWSYVDFGLTVVVYPKPDSFRGLAAANRDPLTEEGIPVPGEEEFNMLRAYRARRCALADRVEGARTRAGDSSPRNSAPWLRASSGSIGTKRMGADVEARLSVLAHWVMQAEGFGQSYGLRIPGTMIAPNRGDMHQARLPRGARAFSTIPRRSNDGRQQRRCKPRRRSTSATSSGCLQP